MASLHRRTAILAEFNKHRSSPVRPVFFQDINDQLFLLILVYIYCETEYVRVYVTWVTFWENPGIDQTIMSFFIYVSLPRGCECSDRTHLIYLYMSWLLSFFLPISISTCPGSYSGCSQLSVLRWPAWLSPHATGRVWSWGQTCAVHCVFAGIKLLVQGTHVSCSFLFCVLFISLRLRPGTWLLCQREVTKF